MAFKVAGGNKRYNKKLAVQPKIVAELDTHGRLLRLTSMDRPL
jgi:hypothetical protein